MRLLTQCPSPGLGMRHREGQCVPSSVVQWELHSVGRKETWTLVQGLLLLDTLRRESPINPTGPQSRSWRNEFVGLNSLRAHCHHILQFISASALTPVPARLFQRLGGTWRGDTPGLESNLPIFYLWAS